MAGSIARKWRPPLALVLCGVLGAVLCLPVLGLFSLRWLQPGLGFRLSALLVGSVVLCVTLIIGALLWRLLLRPVSALAVRARGVGEGNLAATEPLSHYGTRELQSLGQAVLDMAGTLQARERGIRAFADHVTHELRSPLTVMKGAAELLPGSDAADQARLSHTMTEAADRMEALLSGLRDLAQARQPLPAGECRLSEALEGLDPAGLTVTGGDVLVPLSRAVLAVALGHLLANARAHGALRIAVVARAGRITVQDDGTGISEGNRAHVFEPFFTTRREAGGTGMGLAITRSLLESAGARIVLEPSARGAAFAILH